MTKREENLFYSIDSNFLCIISLYFLMRPIYASSGLQFGVSHIATIHFRFPVLFSHLAFFDSN